MILGKKIKQPTFTYNMSRDLSEELMTNITFTIFNDTNATMLHLNKNITVNLKIK